MTGPDDHPDHDRIDPERPRGTNPFDQPDHFTGQVYDIGREREMGRRLPGGQEDRVASGGDPETPPEHDARASFDPATGAVHDVALVEDGGEPSPPPE
ncbi:hypothetical protein [Sphingomonas bacterium]|uniref:hypothetical protein n=1 Tax=Sphingomonas bacterium TaxID=1895847 RepID=UPI001576DE8D|nr:hypothetical protein [Sphingomonas bacterium]